MSWDTKDLKFKNGVPIPQQFDPAVDDWVVYTNEDIKELRTELALVKTELQTIKANQLSGDQKVQQVGSIVALGQLNFAQRFGALAPGTENFIIFSAGKPLEITALAFTTSNVDDVKIELLPRDAEGTAVMPQILTLNGISATNISVSNLRAFDSALWTLVRDEKEGALVKLAVTPFLMPNGGIIRFRNTSEVEINVGAQVLYRTWEGN